MKKLLAAAGMIGVATAAAAWLLVHRVETAEQDWANSLGPLSAVPQRYRTAENMTQRQLANWIPRLVPREKDVRDAIIDHGEQQQKSTTNLEPPNAVVWQYVRAHAADLDEFARWVANNPSPVSSLPLRSAKDDMPDLNPVMRIHKALVSAAMARAAAGDRRGAERLLDASWRLNDSLRNEATMISQLIALAVFRMQLGALRKVAVTSTKWLPRLREHDFRKSMSTSFETEEWFHDRAVRDNVFADEDYLLRERAVYAGLGMPMPFKPRWLQILRTPVRWFNLPSVLEARGEMAMSARALPPSQAIADELTAAHERGAKRWWFAPDPDVYHNSMTSAFKRAARTVAERELTENVIIRARCHSQKRWPASEIDSDRRAFGGRQSGLGLHGHPGRRHDPSRSRAEVPRSHRRSRRSPVRAALTSHFAAKSLCGSLLMRSSIRQSLLR